MGGGCSLMLAALWLLVLAIPARAAEPANPKANAQTRRILDYFHTLQAARTGPRVLSGQFTDFGDGANLKLMTNVFEKTGQWPALIGVDYADFGRGGITWKKPNAVALEYWRQGGLVTISAHMYNPEKPSGGGLRDKGVNLAALLQDGTEAHTRWRRQLDEMAAGLQDLRAAGVTVLWRPFHEMNGGWFWWGAHDPAVFSRVWRHMFDYYSREKGLDNLIWVYGPNHGANAAHFYPGGDCVDLTGVDAYTDFIDPQHIRGFPEVAGLGKPTGFSEFGPHGPEKPPGDYDYRRFIAGLETEFPAARYFMSWGGGWSLATNQYTRELLAHPAIINRDGLPKGLIGGQ